MSDRWWLWLLVILALAVYLACSLCGGLGGPLTAIGCGELLAVAAALWFVCRCRRRLRVGLFLVAVAASLVPIIALAAIASGGWDMVRYELVPVTLLCVSCVVAVALGCIAVRRTFSAGRLLLGFTLGSVGVSVCFSLVMHFAEGMPLDVEYVLPISLVLLPYPLAMYMYAVFNRSSREGLIRVLGLGRDAAEARRAP